MSSCEANKDRDKKKKKDHKCASNIYGNDSGRKVKISAKPSSTSRTDGTSATNIRTGATATGQQTSRLCVRQGTNTEDNWTLQESIRIHEGQLTQGNEVYDVTITEEDVMIQGSPEIDLPRVPPKEWYDEDEFNISPLKSDYGDLSGEGTADLSPLDINIDFDYVPYAGLQLSDDEMDEAQIANISPLSEDDDYGLGISPPCSPVGTPPSFSSPLYESPYDASCSGSPMGFQSPTSPTSSRPSTPQAPCGITPPQMRSPSDAVRASSPSPPIIVLTPPAPRKISKGVKVQTFELSVPKTSCKLICPRKKPSDPDPPSNINTKTKMINLVTYTSPCSAIPKKSKSPDRSSSKSRPRSKSIGASVSPKPSKDKSPTPSYKDVPSTSREQRAINIPKTLITQPKIIEHQEEREVAPLQMDSPVGRIEAATSMIMSRKTVGSSKGTVIDHSLVGTKTVSPGKAKQIVMTKKELIPPPVSRSGIRPPGAVGVRPPGAVGLKPPGAVGLRPPGAVGLRPPGAVGLRPPYAGGLRPPSGMKAPSIVGSAATSATSSSKTSSSRMASPRTQYTAVVSPIEDVEQGVLPPEVALDRPNISSPRMQAPAAARVIQAPSQIPSGTCSRAPSGIRPPGAGRASGIRPPSQQSSKYEVTGPAQRVSPSREPLPAARRVPVGPATPGVIASSPEMLKQKLTNRPISLVNWKNEMQNYNQTFNAPLREQHPDIQSANLPVRQAQPRPEEQARWQRQRTLEESLDPSLPEAYWSSSMKEAMALAEDADLPVISPSVSSSRSPQRPPPPRVPQAISRLRPPTGMIPTGLQALSRLRPPTGMRLPSVRRSTSPQSSTCGVTCPSNARAPTPRRTPTPPAQRIPSTQPDFSVSDVTCPSTAARSQSPRSSYPPVKEWYDEDEYNISSLKSFSDDSEQISFTDALSPNYDINLDYSLYANMNFSDGSIPESIDDMHENVSCSYEDDMGFDLGFSDDEEDMVCPGSPRAIAQRIASPQYVESRISPVQPQYSTNRQMAPVQYAHESWLPTAQPQYGVRYQMPPDEPTTPPISAKFPKESPKKKSSSKLLGLFARKKKKEPSPSKSSAKVPKGAVAIYGSQTSQGAIEAPGHDARTRAEMLRRGYPEMTFGVTRKGPPTAEEMPVQSLYQRQSRAPRRPCSVRVQSAPRTTSSRSRSAPARPYKKALGRDLYEADEELSQSLVEPSLLSRKITTQPHSPKSQPSPINLEVSIKVPTSARGANASIVKKLVDEEREDALVCKMLMSPLKDKLGKLKKKPQAVKLLEETMNQSIPGDDEGDSLKSDIMAALMATEEKGKIDSAKSPRRTYETLFPPLRDEPLLAVSPAGPAPLQDIVVPVGEADMEDVAIVNEDIRSTCATQDLTDMPTGNLYAQSLAQMKDNAGVRRKAASEKKEKEKQRLEIRKRSTEKAAAPPRDDEPYIPTGELDEERPPWEINLDDLEEIVGAQMSTLREDLPSDESIRAIKGRLEYILEYEKPMHYSCVQLRGSQTPNWFPGYYSVFPHTPNFVRLEKSPSRVMHVAWHIFAPSDVLDNSEVIISEIKF